MTKKQKKVFYYKAGYNNSNNDSTEHTFYGIIALFKYVDLQNHIESLTLKKNIAMSYFDSRVITNQQSLTSGIKDQYLYDNFIITLADSSMIEFTKLYLDNTNEHPISSSSTQYFMINGQTGKFRNIKKVKIDFDNEGISNWNPNHVPRARRITMYQRK